MSHVYIVTDSTADIPKHIREELNIAMVPLKVHFGQESYLDAIDLTPSQFYEKLAAFDDLPTTSQPSPADFLDIYQRILKEDPNAAIISIHISSALSGTYQSATVAKTMLEVEADITIFDTKSASYGIGLIAVKAAEAAASGMAKNDIVALIEKIRAQAKLYFYVNTLEYLQRGGRIGKASALIGSLLQIKPILSIDDEGEVHPIDKVRGSKKAIARMLQLMDADFAGKPIEVIIAHSNAPEDAEQWLERLRGTFDVVSEAVTEIGSVIGTHAGPGAVGIFLIPSMKDESA